MAPQHLPLPDSAYTVGWICALPVELQAAMTMLDKQHGSHRKQDPSDPNNYTLGQIGEHNVVLAGLPSGKYGIAEAAKVGTRMLRSFESIQIRLMVGVAGGIPSDDHDIRLGDVVVSNPDRRSGGVIQYDFGKTLTSGKFEVYGSLGRPTDSLLSAVTTLRAQHDLGSNNMSVHLEGEKKKKCFPYPGAELDVMYESNYHHPAKDKTCTSCDPKRQKYRPPRPSTNPVIHYGLIASANQVVKDAETRDRLQQELGALCFEMEAAGLMDDFRCLIIRGICDYSDSHKNKDWQGYAAANAAAYAKDLLSILPAVSTMSARTEEYPSPPPSYEQAVKLPSPSQAASTQGWNEVHGSNAAKERSDSKASTELELRRQQLRRQVPGLIKEVTSNLSSKLQWVPYLSAAPSAICIMAACLVSGSSNGTRTIKIRIESKVLKDLGIERDECEYLGDALQYCSDLGRRAFEEAESRMESLRYEADRMIDITGPISYIVAILNDLNPDFSALESQLSDLECAADTCLDEARKMSISFSKLLDFIKGLKRATGRAKTQNIVKIEGEKKASRDPVSKTLEEQLRQAEIERDALQKEVDEAKNREWRAHDRVQTVFSCQDRLEEIDMELSQIKEPSFLGISWGVFFNSRDAVDREKRKQDLQNERAQLMKQRDKLLNHDQANALDEHKLACSMLSAAEERLRLAQEKHTSLTKEQLQASRSFQNACEDLRRLSDNDLDLQTLQDILQRSIEDLKNLDNYVQAMAKYFSGVSKLVKDVMEDRLRRFKDQTTRLGDRYHQDADNNRHKVRAIVAALDLHGRFALVEGIARVYVEVSERYITPGIGTMDSLMDLGGEEYEMEINEFRQWGTRAVAEIKDLAKEENEKIRTTVYNGMGGLFRQQIG